MFANADLRSFRNEIDAPCAPVMQNITCGKILRNHLPTFCWQTFEEVISFVEQLNEEASDRLVAAVLHKLIKSGIVESRDADRRKINKRFGMYCREYRRVEC